MTNIRVDPSELADVSESLSAAAENLRAKAEEVASEAAGAPKYDGQFGPQVRGMALEAHSPLWVQAKRLTELSEQLRAIAEAFSSADEEGIQAFEGLAELLRLSTPDSLLQALLGTSLDRYADLPTPGEGGGGPLENEEDDELSLLDRFPDLALDQVKDPGFHWQWITDRDAAAWLRTIHGLPTAVLGIRGWDDTAGSFVRYIDTDLAIRSFGRLIGDASLPPLFLIGWGLTLAPEQYENIKTGAEWNEFVGDAIVDTGGFAVGEVGGWAVAAGTSWTGPGLVAGKLGADVLAGIGYEFLAERDDWRGHTTEWVGGLPGDLAIWYSAKTEEYAHYADWYAQAMETALNRENIRVPTPPVEPIPTTTPTPQPMSADPTSPAGEPSISGPTPTPTPPGSEPVPRPNPTPAPPEG